MIVEHGHGGHGERVRRDGLRSARHDLFHLRVAKIAAHVARHVAIGDNADEAAVAIDDAHAAEAFF